MKTRLSILVMTLVASNVALASALVAPKHARSAQRTDCANLSGTWEAEGAGNGPTEVLTLQQFGCEALLFAGDVLVPLNASTASSTTYDGGKEPAMLLQVHASWTGADKVDFLASETYVDPKGSRGSVTDVARGSLQLLAADALVYMESVDGHTTVTKFRKK